MNTIYLSIGSNTDPEVNLKHIVRLIRNRIKMTAVSPVYESADAHGGEMVYLNAALILETELDPEALKVGYLEVIEDRLFRESSGVFVTADIDIVLVNDEVMTYMGREIPDPGVLQHAFIALPLADIAPDYVHPVTGQTMREIAAAFDDAPIRRRDDLRL
jgi:2-amino-4-hydroxy-6-hydroxymethyldihydropteridine diphosphokinase